MKYKLVEIETYIHVRFFLCTEIEMLSIQKQEYMTKVQVKKHSTLNSAVNQMLI